MRMTFGPLPDKEQEQLREDFARVFRDAPIPLPPLTPEQEREADETQKRG